MRAHFFQHVPFEGLGSIEAWLQAAGYRISGTCFFESAAMPDAAEVDLLIVMGGPMSVNDEQLHPWLVAEKRYIRHAIESGTPVLGVCLGAQLIASALGARVFPNAEKEIGWFPVFAVAAAETAGLPFPAAVDVLHWHGETFDLPPGAVHLARSSACENQAYRIGTRVIGLQFHLEATPQSVRCMIDNDRAELQCARPHVQSAQQLLAAPARCYRESNALMAALLEALTAGSYEADRDDTPRPAI